MMKILLSSILILFFTLPAVNGQDSIQYRIIVLGNAGVITKEQKSIINNAAGHSIPGRTIALFLGNSIYPSRLGSSNKKSGLVAQNILYSQYAEFRKKGVPVFFIPGIAEWDNNGPEGYAKMLQFNEFIQNQNDTFLQVIPSNACPGPIALQLSKDVIIVAMDTEWWLYPFNKHLDEVECECKTKRAVMGKLNDIIDRNRDKIIFFTTSHPFKSNGIYGGYYPLKKNIFSFANAKNNLYITLPVIGSIYPLFRKIFPPITDIDNPLYQDMRREITAILKNHPNIYHLSAHDHSLQLIQDRVAEVISGAVAKITPVKKTNGTTYAESVHGYVIADVLKNNTVRLTFNKQSKKNIQKSFLYEKTFTKPVILAPENVKQTLGDSIEMALNENYAKVSRLHRSLLG